MIGSFFVPCKLLSKSGSFCNLIATIRGVTDQKKKKKAIAQNGSLFFYCLRWIAFNCNAHAVTAVEQISEHEVR